MSGWFATMQNYLVQAYKAKEASTTDYAALHGAVERMCAAKNIRKPKIYIGESSAMAKAKAFVCATPNAIYISEDAPAFFGTHAPASAISAEFESVLGHELKHVQGGLAEVVAKRSWTFALPLLLVGGMFFHDRAAQKAKDDVTHATIEHLQRMSPEATHDAILKDALDRRLLAPEDVVHAGDKRELMIDLLGGSRQSVLEMLSKPKYVVAAAAGITGGHLMNGAMSRQFEFQADRLGAELTSRHASTAALERMQAAIAQDGGIAEKTILARIGQLFSSHPTLENRIGALR